MKNKSERRKRRASQATIAVATHGLEMGDPTPVGRGHEIIIRRAIEANDSDRAGGRLVTPAVDNEGSGGEGHGQGICGMR